MTIQLLQVVNVDIPKDRTHNALRRGGLRKDDRGVSWQIASVMSRFLFLDSITTTRRRARWTKPKQGKIEKAIPRPKKPEVEESEGEDEHQADPEHEQSEDDDGCDHAD